MSRAWFRPKTRGYGAGRPIHWKGWALLAAFIAAIIVFPFPLEYYLGRPANSLERLAVIIAIAVPFIWIIKRKTEGGWHWRSGKDEDEDGD